MCREAEKYEFFFGDVEVERSDAAKLAVEARFIVPSWSKVSVDDVAMVINDILPPACDVTPRGVVQPIRKLTNRLWPVVWIWKWNNVQMSHLIETTNKRNFNLLMVWEEWSQSLTRIFGILFVFRHKLSSVSRHSPASLLQNLESAPFYQAIYRRTVWNFVLCHYYQNQKLHEKSEMKEYYRTVPSGVPKWDRGDRCPLRGALYRGLTKKWTLNLSVENGRLRS